MKHQDFRAIAAAEALDTIEASLLPSLALLIDRAAGAEPGLNAEPRAAELRALAEQLESLTAMLERRPRPDQPADPFSTEA